jgi:hypothetical protein
MTLSIMHQTYKIYQENNPKKLDLVIGYRKLERPIHKVSTDDMPQSSLEMEIKGIDIEFDTHST